MLYQMVTGQTPFQDPEGKYHSNFANMFGQTSKLLTPAGNDCRECHRLGDGTSCRVFAKEYVEKKHKNGTKDKFWMPFDYAGDLRKDYGSGIDQLARCCDDPSLAECKTRDATPENTGRNR